MASGGEIGLADFIRGLRDELAAAIEEGSGKEIRFRPGPIDLELELEVERKDDREGKIEFKVFGTGASIGGKGGQTNTRTQSLKMRLELDDSTLISGRVIAPPS